MSGIYFGTGLRGSSRGVPPGEASPKGGYPEDPGCPEFTGKLPGQPRIANLNLEYESDRSLEDRGAPGR